MPLELLPWEDEDFQFYPELIWRAFKDDLMGVLYPNGYSQADREHTTRTSLAKARKHGKDAVWMKIIDTDLPADDDLRQITSVAHWHFYPHERSAAELDAEQAESEKEDSSPPPGLNRAFADQFFGDIGRLRRDIMGGQPYILLHMLAVRPSHHRRGIGGMHLSWGDEKADELGLPLYLEASPMGRPLYERHGYEKVMDLPCDARGHGHPKDLPHVCMLRPAKKTSGGA